MTLFDYADQYPQSPGWKNRATSFHAAEDMKTRAPTLRDLCLSQLALSPATADQVAAQLGKSVLSIRPRITELARLGFIRDTGRTAANESGKQAVIWCAEIT